ncbi:MAG: metal ABC transporter ATP-binding protein [Nitrospira sp.]|nr:metal ABC transporter ATP-binding protein [Nitrospira sp.]
MSTIAVDFVGVSSGYEGKPIFERLNLQIRQGQFAGIVGPTGCGKTTLLKTILGAIDPFSGSVRVMGDSIGRIPAGTIGYVPQLETVDWSFPVTVEEVVIMGLYNRMGYLPWPSKEEKGHVQVLMKKLGIDDCAHHHIRDISGGQQQRTFLARALVGNPRLLVLDEPTAGIDIKTQHDVLHLLGELNREGMTIVLTTHDLNSVAAHLPFVICFNKGIVAAGPPHEIFNSDILKRTYGADVIVIEHGDHLLMSHGTPLSLNRH